MSNIRHANELSDLNGEAIIDTRDLEELRDRLESELADYPEEPAEEPEATLDEIATPPYDGDLEASAYLWRAS